jgi:hypothetical protein
LDACHLKGEIGGQLLCVIGKDGNNDMFPIAYTVAEGETRSSWEWFIGLLIDDIYVESGEGHGWTVMSDQQKVMRKSCLLFFFSFFFLFLNFIDRILCKCVGAWSHNKSFVATY